MFFDPFAGWRRVTSSEHRTRQDWAHQIKRLLDEDYSEARKVHLVCFSANAWTDASATVPRSTPNCSPGKTPATAKGPRCNGDSPPPMLGFACGISTHRVRVAAAVGWAPPTFILIDTPTCRWAMPTLQGARKCQPVKTI